jgi:hypothetical protein
LFDGDGFYIRETLKDEISGKNGIQRRRASGTSKNTGRICWRSSPRGGAKWYELGLVSQEKAAEIAGLNRMKFLLAISRIGISPFQYTAEAVLKEVENVKPASAE